MRDGTKAQNWNTLNWTSPTRQYYDVCPTVGKRSCSRLVPLMSLTSFFRENWFVFTMNFWNRCATLRDDVVLMCFPYIRVSYLWVFVVWEKFVLCDVVCDPRAVCCGRLPCAVAVCGVMGPSVGLWPRCASQLATTCCPRCDRSWVSLQAPAAPRRITGSARRHASQPAAPPGLRPAIGWPVRSVSQPSADAVCNRAAAGCGQTVPLPGSLCKNSGLWEATYICQMMSFPVLKWSNHDETEVINCK